MKIHFLSGKSVQVQDQKLPSDNTFMMSKLHLPLLQMIRELQQDINQTIGSFTDP